MNSEDQVKASDFDMLLEKIGGKNSRLNKLVKDITSLDQEYSILVDKSDSKSIRAKPEVKQYWERVLSATMKIACHIFETPQGEHPLLYQEPVTKIQKWITSSDIEYMTLILIYAIIREAWKKNILVIGLIKDTSALELLKTIVLILRNAQKVKSRRRIG